MRRFIIILISNIMMLSIVAQTSIKELEKAAKNGDATAQLNLGLSYMDGTDGKQNDKKAFEWLLKAANQGKFEACIPIARMIDQNRISGFKQKELYGWLNRAADSDNSEILIKVADEFLRLSNDESKTVDKKKNFARAFELYEKANKLTSDIAIKKEIAAKYQSNKGILGALNLYLEMAKMGDAESQYTCGKYYYDNNDLESACPWLEKSYKQGYSPAKELYQTCEKRLEQKRVENEGKKGVELPMSIQRNENVNLVLEVKTPGTLFEQLPEIIGLGAIKSLTIKGILNSEDFSTINKMKNLKELDLSDAVVFVSIEEKKADAENVAFLLGIANEGQYQKDGNYQNYKLRDKLNDRVKDAYDQTVTCELPRNAFIGNPLLETLKLPTTLTKINMAGIGGSDGYTLSRMRHLKEVWMSKLSEMKIPIKKILGYSEVQIYIYGW